MITLINQSDLKCLGVSSLCGGQRYKCDPLTHVCIPTRESMLNQNVYGSICECQKNCGCLPCETDGCDFHIQFYYLSAWREHQCNRAVFDAYCGSRSLGTVNLNNWVDGGDRFSPWFDIYASDFIAENCSYTFRLDCALSYCHTGVSGMKFKLGGIEVFDLPRQSGDAWSVCANDICNPAP